MCTGVLVGTMGDTVERSRTDDGQFRGSIPPERALEVFEEREDRARPLTASDIAEALDCSRRTAHNKLGELVDRGELETRKVGARSRVWWRPLPREPESAGRPRAEGVSDAVSEAVSEANLPGAGPQLEARREALLAAFDYLQDNPGATKSDFLQDVYPDHRADFESAEGWWNAIQPALGDLPGVDPPKERGHIWHFLGG